MFSPAGSTLKVIMLPGDAVAVKDAPRLLPADDLNLSQLVFSSDYLTTNLPFQPYLASSFT